jgi:hypothetical protein
MAKRLSTALIIALVTDLPAMSTKLVAEYALFRREARPWLVIMHSKALNGLLCAFLCNTTRFFNRVFESLSKIFGQCHHANILI